MKLLIKKSKKTDKINCKFSGSTADAIAAIVAVMSQQEIIEEIILTAAEYYQEKFAEIKKEVLDNSKVQTNQQKSNKKS